jgi:hypothetical protein
MLTRTSAAVAFLMLAPLGPAWAADTPASRATLKGAPPLTVVVSIVDLDPELSEGLTQVQIRMDVEERLRQGGIRVDTAAPVLSTAPVLLSVDLDAFRAGIGYAFNSRVEFVQNVTILRTGQSTAWAPTWSVSSMGVSVGGFSNGVRYSVRALVDRFINAFLSVNPKP